MFPHIIVHLLDVLWCGFSTQSCRKRGGWEAVPQWQLWPKAELLWGAAAGWTFLWLLTKLLLKLLNAASVSSPETACTWMLGLVFCNLLFGVSGSPLRWVQNRGGKGLSKPHPVFSHNLKENQNLDVAEIFSFSVKNSVHFKYILITQSF